MASREYANLTSNGDTLITKAKSQRSGSPSYLASVQLAGTFGGATVEILKGHTGLTPSVAASSTIAPSYTSPSNFLIDDVAGVGDGVDVEYYVSISGATGSTDITVSVIDHR